MKVELRELISEKVPGTSADHVADDAAPPKDPLSWIGEFTQNGWYVPASTVASAWTSIM